MHAKKSLGQHFLKSERALSAIIEAGKVARSDTILEIGPGTGTLTEKLLETDAKVIAIEKDDTLFELLKQKFEKDIKNEKLKLIHDDILDFKTSEIKNYKLIANIPYNITGAILKKFLEAKNQPEIIVLLVQKEVARRIVAANKKESVLSISVKTYGTPKYVETVKAGSFAPMPKVDSAIIVIENISKSFFKHFSEKDFFTLLRASFQSKRKKLSSNLSKIYPKERVIDAFKTLGLSENTRAEDVSTEMWGRIAKSLY